MALCITVTALIFPNGALAQDAGNQLSALFADEWQYRLRNDPLQATGYGVQDYNDRLTDVSPSVYEKHAVKDREFLKRLDHDCACNQRTKQRRAISFCTGKPHTRRRLQNLAHTV